MGIPLLLTAFLAVQAAPQPQAAPAPADGGAQKPAEATLKPDELPVNVDRIQKALSQPPAIKVTDTRPVFRVEVFAPKPTIEDILGPDYLKGPVPYGGMTHQEFLDMVTPKDVQGYAAFSNKQGAIVAATSFAFQWAIQQAVQKYKDAKSERDREAARKEVQEALDALLKARREAGLPDK